MSCSSCGTKKEGSGASSCGTGGGCSSGGCGQMGVYNWLGDMQMPGGEQQYPYVEVRFKGTRKEFYKNPENLPLQVGDVVAVESSPGHDMGVITIAGDLVRLQLKKKNINPETAEFKSVYRKARESDIEKWEEARKLENPTMFKAREISKMLNLNMKLSDVEYQGDMKKAIFYYTADERVDFRELIKKLAEEFKCRVEMKQIGMRQEAGRLGGIGSCGRELCCSTWLTDFRSVSTGAARYQNLSLNPMKLAGQCGKLKCCLNYELDSYLDALKDLPATDSALKTEKGNAYHRKTDIFKKQMWYSYSMPPRDGGDTLVADSNWVQLPIKRVKQILELNKGGIFPPDLREEVASNFVMPVKKLDYDTVVGQDSLTRFDKPKPKKNYRPKPQNSGSVQSERPQGNPNPGANNNNRRRFNNRRPPNK